MKLGVKAPRTTKVHKTKAPKSLKKTKRTLQSTTKRSLQTTPSLHPSITLVKGQKRNYHPISTHIDKPYNNAKTPFEFTADSLAKIDKVLKKFPANYKQSAVMPVLFIAQEQNDNWLPLSAMNKVAEILDMPPMRVYEVATFYTMYNRDKVGKFHIQVCGTTTCMTMGAREIKAAAKKFAGVHHDGEISKDNLFYITEVECLGACTNAPMIQVNNHEFYENLTEETIVKVMKGLIDGTAKVGPQNGQKVAEGPLGQTTLIGYEDHFPAFDMSRFDAKLAEMKTAAAAPPKTEAPKAEAPKAEAPKTEAPKTEAPKAEAPKAAPPKTEVPASTAEKKA